MKTINQTLKLKNGKSCILRNPNPNDAEQLIDYLKISSMETDFLLKYKEEIDLTIEQEKDFLQRFIDSDRDLMISVEIDGRIVGNCSFSPVGNKIRVKHRCSMGIALFKEVWGLGIGTALLEILIREAKNCGYEQMELDVNSRNERAISLYQKMGFLQCGTQPNAMKYKDGTYADMIMMIREL